MNNQKFRPKAKTVLGGIPNGFVNNHSKSRDSKIQMNNYLYFSDNSNFSQCKRCGESCAKYKYESREGLCRTCEQFGEYVIREFPKYRKSSQVEVTR